MVDYNLRRSAERFRTVANNQQSIGGKIEVAPAQPADFRWLQGLTEQQHNQSLVASRGAGLASCSNQDIDFVEVEELAITAVGEREFAWRRLKHGVINFSPK